MNLRKSFQNALKSNLDQAAPDLGSVRTEDLQPLPSLGLSHDHIRIGNSGWLLRIPRGNQLGMDAADYLQLQATCFDIAAQSGHAPSIKGIIQPNDALTHGALIVEEIKGRKAIYPKDAAAIAKAFAELHKIRPTESKLQTADKPFASQHFLLTQVFGNALNHAKISDTSRILLKNEHAEVTAKLDQLAINQYPLTLIGGDSHPANFIITSAQKAYLVDVEFATFDTPYIDLADASLAITQRLEPDTVIWTDKARQDFFDTWQNHTDPDLVQGLQSGRHIAEQAVRLRTLLWLADWTTGTQANMENHVNFRTKENWDRMVSTYLEPEMLKRILKGDQGPYLPPLPRTIQSTGPLSNP